MHVPSIFGWPLAVTALLGASAAHAQQVDPGSIERTVPKFEPKPIERQPRVETPAAPAQGGARVAGTFVLSAVNIEGATVFSSDQLSRSFEPFLASRVGQAELDQIAAGITEQYRRAGYILSYAMVPQQSVQSGIVRIRVVEGYVDKVRVQGDSRSAAAIRAIAERLDDDRPLRKATLERLLGLMRDVPGVSVTDARIGRSSTAEPARHTITLTLGANRVRALLYSDNRGTVPGARFRAYSSVNLSSLAVPGDDLQLDLFSIPSDDFHFIYGMAKASAPIGADGLRLAASISRAATFQRLSGPNQRGKSRQLVLDLAYPFAKSRAFSLAGHISLGEWRSEDRIGGALFQRDRIPAVRAWVELSRSAKIRIDGKVTVSQGLHLGSSTDHGDPLASRPFADAGFTKLNADFQVATALSANLTLRVDTAVQVSAHSLLAPEEFALGGSRIGRAFDFNTITGDEGFGAMAELSYRIADAPDGVKSLEVFGYADGGAAFRKRSSPGLPGEQWLSSVGMGSRFSALGLIWSGEIGAPLHSPRKRRSARASFSLTRPF